MSVNKFAFKSPGISFGEDDNTLKPNTGSGIAPLFIGLAQHGGQMRPITIESAEELINVFGKPVSGTAGSDVWREGNVLSPTYAVYGALAYLKHNSPITFIRLAGHEHPDRVDNAGEAGFKTDHLEYTDNSSSSTQSTNGGAYGLFIGDYDVPKHVEAVDYIGSGLNDLSVKGEYTGDGVAVVEVTMNMTVPGSIADNFSWTLLRSDGTSSSGSAVDITGGYQELVDGIYVKFDNLTGHSAGDIWRFSTDSYGELTYAGKFYVNDGALSLTGEPVGGLEASGFTFTDAGGGDTDDLEILGHYQGTDAMIQYRVTLDSASTFIVEYSVDGGMTWINVLASTSIDTAPHSLGNGLYIRFKQGSAGTRTTNDQWTWSHTVGVNMSGFATMFVSSGDDYEFKLKYYDKDWSDSSGNPLPNNELETIRFNFNPDSRNYIRKMFNTNPTLVNGEITSPENVKSYWLGETFDQSLKMKLNNATGAKKQVAILLKIEGENDLSGSGADYRYPAQSAVTGWVFAQDFSDDYTKYDPKNMQKLFRFKAMEDGEWSQANLKISIDNIRYSTTSSDPYGKFDVLLRKANDSDRRKNIVERYSNCNLDPNSPNYIGKQIGTAYYEYDEETKRYKKRGKYPNVSKYIYVEIDSAVETKAINPYSLPFGFYGQPVFKDIDIDSSNDIVFGGNDLVRGGSTVAGTSAPFEVSTGNDHLFDGNSKFLKYLLTDRSNRLRKSTSEEGLTFAKNAFWGVLSSREGSYKPDYSYGDIVRPKSVMANQVTGDDIGMKYSFIFSLDDVRYETTELSGGTGYSSNTSKGTYDPSGVIGRAVGKSITAGEEYDSSGSVVPNTPSYQLIIDAGMARFTLPFQGGFDGLDRTEKNPFRNEVLERNSGDVTRNYAFYTISKLIDIISDKEFLKFDKVLIPGMTNQILNQSLVAMTEERKDCLAIIDIAKQYQPPSENYLDEATRTGSVGEAINELIGYGFDDSYAVAPFNWLIIKDNLNNNNVVELPPSVGYIDVMSMSQALAEIWFSPAGYTRGNLSSEEAGLNYIGTKFVLTESDRDALAEAHFNPFVELPEGILMFNDLTLKQGETALNQVSTRMLMIYIKYHIQQMASRVLFDPNIEVTWQRFVSMAEPFLAGVKTKLGLESYKIILDKSTTTPDLQERNIVYGKVYIKPMYSIRNIAIDFVLTDDGTIFKN